MMPFEMVTQCTGRVQHELVTGNNNVKVRMTIIVSQSSGAIILIKNGYLEELLETCTL
jgi:hypothetical protein